MKCLAKSLDIARSNCSPEAKIYNYLTLLFIKFCTIAIQYTFPKEQLVIVTVTKITVLQLMVGKK